MGSLTRAGMDALVKFRMMNMAGIDTQITDAVKFSYDELITSIRIPENQETAVVSLVEGQILYATPADFYAIVSLHNITDSKRLSPISLRGYEKLPIQALGEPKRYMIWKNELYILPGNNATSRVLRLRYIKRLASLSLSTSVSVLPREWDEVIIQGAVARTLSWMGDKQAAQIENAIHSQMVNRRLDRLAEQDFDRDDSARPQLVEKQENIGSGE